MKKINKNYSPSSYILFFFTFSFIGWVWEVILHLVMEGTLVNKGTLYGPYIHIYGIGSILILLVLDKFKQNKTILFFLSMLLCGTLEYIGSVYLEKVNHLKYWDYSNYILNINGRVCLYSLLLFGALGFLLTYYIAPYLDKKYSLIKDKTKKIICIILVIIFSIDFMYATFVKPNTGKGISEEVIITKHK